MAVDMWKLEKRFFSVSTNGYSFWYRADLFVQICSWQDFCDIQSYMSVNLFRKKALDPNGYRNRVLMYI